MQSYAVPIFAALAVALGGCDRQVAGGSNDGARIYAEACARCHGAAGQPPVQMTTSLGVRDLTGAEWLARRDRNLVVHQIRHGSTNGRMPPFTGALAEPQIEAVADHVMELAP